MSSISNSFVTIEFENDQRKEAEYLLKLFNSEPEFYKGLLNGKTSICSEDFIVYKDDDEEHRELNKFNVNRKIMRMNGVSDKVYPFDDRTNFSIYNSIMEYVYGNPSEVLVREIGITLAYDYFKKTKDFEYLKNYLYEDGITDDDIMEICIFNIMNYYKDLLREKVHTDVLTLSNNKFVTDDFPGLMHVLNCVTTDVMTNIKSRFNPSNMSKEQVDMLRNSTIPKIDENQFENLVVGALKYIDPTNKLLDEYIKCRDENRIEPTFTPEETSFFYVNNNNYGIKLYKYGNIEDVISLAHELGHMHYRINNNHRGNELFDEYPSIYYELKTAEFLKTVGYSEDDVNNAMVFRLNNNISNLASLIPIMQSVHTNIDKDVEDYDLSAFNNMIDKFERGLNISFLRQVCTEDEIEQLEEQLMTLKCSIIKSTTNLLYRLKYVVGTFFSKDAINNLKHEDALKILEDITSNEYSLSDAFRIQGIIPNDGELEKQVQDKQKVKKLHITENGENL